MKTRFQHFLFNSVHKNLGCSLLICLLPSLIIRLSHLSPGRLTLVHLLLIPSLFIGENNIFMHSLPYLIDDDLQKLEADQASAWDTNCAARGNTATVSSTNMPSCSGSSCHGFIGERKSFKGAFIF